MSDDLLDGTATQSDEELQVSRRLEGPPQIAGYQLETLQGRGSFGEVWSGLQLRSGQKVAVKIFLTTDPSFHKEVERLSQVAEHPNVVSLLDADLEGQPPYFVMNLYPGSLADWFKRQTLPIDPAPVTKWLEQIARALRHTHQRGLLHCDLKPSNVLLDIEGQAQLADFGQSILRESGTRSLGTTGFMAPEQAEARAVPDIRWDIYALGATVYYLLSGARFEGIPLPKLNKLVDTDLAAIVHACLALDPARRPEGMPAILDDLERRRRKLPLLCRRPWSRGYLARRFLRRHALGTAFAGVLTATVAGGGWVLWEQFQSTKAMLAQQDFRQGWSRADVGEQAEAMLWWAEAVRFAPEHAGYRRPLKDYPFPVQQMLEHNGRLECCLFNRDGTRLLAASRDGSARLWDVANWELLADIPAAGPQADDPVESTLRSAAFAPDGSFVTASLNGPVRRWSAEGKPAGELPAAREVACGGRWLLALTDKKATIYEGQRLIFEEPADGAVLSESHLVTWKGAHATLRELPNGKPVALEGEAAVLSACFDGSQLALARHDTTVTIYDGPRRQQVKTGKPAFCLDLREGKLAAAGYMGGVEVWDVAEQHQLFATQHLRWAPLGCKLTKDDRLLAWSYYGVARMWNATTGEPWSPSFVNEGSLKSAVVNRAGNLLALGAGDGTVRVVRLVSQPPEEITLVDGDRKASFPTVSFLSPDGRAALGCGKDGRWRLWDTSTGQRRCPDAQATLTPGFPLQGAFSDDSQTFVVVGAHPRAYHTSDASPCGAAVPDCKPGSGYYTAALSPDGRRMATLELDNTVTLWDVATGQALGEPFKTASMPISCSFSPDGRRLALGCFDQKVRIYEEGREIQSFSHQMFVAALRYSPRGVRLLSGAGDGTARIWRHGEPSSAPMAHDGAVLSVAFGDGCVATSAMDGKARLWDDDGEPLTPPLNHPMVTAVGFSEDRRTLLSLSGSTLRRWDAALNTDDSPAEVRRRAEVATGMKLEGVTGQLSLSFAGFWPRLQFTAPIPTLRPLTRSEWEARRNQVTNR